MGVHRAVSAGRVEIDALTRRVRERGGYRRLLSSFVLAIGGPFNLIGVIVGSSRAKEKPAKWKLNRLGIILNASPYVIGLGFSFIAYIAGAVAEFFS